jgi:hypothetical protein
VIESRILNLEQAGSSGYLLALECGSLFCHHDNSCSTAQSDCRDDTLRMYLIHSLFSSFRHGSWHSLAVGLDISSVGITITA